MIHEIDFYPDAHVPEKTTTTVLGKRKYVLSLVDTLDGSQHPLKFESISSAAEVAEWLRSSSQPDGLPDNDGEPAKWVIS